MTTPDRSPLGDSPEASDADLAEQHIPVDDVDEESWRDAARRVGPDRDWQANEADLLEQSMAVPDDDSEFDR